VCLWEYLSSMTTPEKIGPPPEGTVLGTSRVYRDLTHIPDVQREYTREALEEALASIDDVA